MAATIAALALAFVVAVVLASIRARDLEPAPLEQIRKRHREHDAKLRALEKASGARRG